MNTNGNTKTGFVLAVKNGPSGHSDGSRLPVQYSAGGYYTAAELIDATVYRRERDAKSAIKRLAERTFPGVEGITYEIVPATITVTLG